MVIRKLYYEIWVPFPSQDTEDNVHFETSAE